LTWAGPGAIIRQAGTYRATPLWRRSVVRQPAVGVRPHVFRPGLRVAWSPCRRLARKGGRRLRSGQICRLEPPGRNSVRRGRSCASGVLCVGLTQVWFSQKPVARKSPGSVPVSNHESCGTWREFGSNHWCRLLCCVARVVQRHGPGSGMRPERETFLTRNADLGRGGEHRFVSRALC
jgi:hypothetical protein